MTPAELVSAARDLLGTPFHHQGRLPGIGVDCAGVVVCACAACGYAIADRIGYSRIPNSAEFTRAVREHCDPVPLEALRIGDLMTFAFRENEQHIAIVSEITPVIMLIHAWEGVGKVVENSLDSTWRGRLRGCYRLQGIA